jgi:polar amino acid transport system permease protein
MMNDILYILSGIFVTLQYCIGALVVGFSLGVFFGILKYTQKNPFLINAFVSLFRGTPVILQLSFIYFVLPEFLGFNLSVLEAGITAFGLNSAAYVTEIIWAGINAIPKGQFEAAKSLHISKFWMWKDIILPQVFNRMLPAISNEVITLLKETALISVLGEVDIMRRAQYLAAEQFTYFKPLCIAGLTYYCLVQLLTFFFNYVQRKWHYA